MKGDPVELKWNYKDLAGLNSLLPFIRDRRAVVQAGGCLGVFAKKLAAEFEAVYVFEPSEQFVDMTSNAPEKNVVRFQAALGNAAGMVKSVCSLRPNDGKTVLHPGMARVEGGGIIPTMCLDWLALPHVDLVCLDVEGYELYALQGMRDTIIRCKPFIVVEINRGIEYMGLRGDDVRDFLASLGYKYHSRHRSDETYVWGNHAQQAATA